MESTKRYLRSIFKVPSSVRDPSQDISKIFQNLEALKDPAFRITFLGSEILKPCRGEQDKTGLPSVSGEKSHYTKVTLAMVLTNAEDEIVDSKDLLPISFFESEGVEVREGSRQIDEKDYNVITLCTDSYQINIIRASDLYIDGVTPHCIHLPSELWQSIAKSEGEIRDFGTKPPICAATMGDNLDHVGSMLAVEKFDPMHKVPDIDRSKYRFGIHLKPCAAKHSKEHGKLACIFYVRRQP